MKLTIIFVTLSTIAILFVVSWSVIGSPDMSYLGLEGVSLRGSTNKSVFVLGEPVKVEFEFVNTGEVAMKIPSGGVEVGSLKILIAFEQNSGYKQYLVSDWGRKMGKWIDLLHGSNRKYDEVTILWNGKPKVSHLNEEAAKRVLAGKITTEYAFQETGIYFIKGVSYFGEDATPIESEPIRIEIIEPRGEDLEVWKQIKRNREIAGLMQYGVLDTGEATKKQRLISKIEEILSAHPGSTYSSYLRPNLEKFKADEIRRKERLEKAMKPVN